MDAVTGAFSYTGRAIAEELLIRGRAVRTLTRLSAPGHPLSGRIAEAPLQFADRAALHSALDGVDTLYNTYWVRFAHGATTFDRAVRNSSVLFDAAKEAGVRRIVHVSVTGAAPESSLPYFRGKWAVDSALAGSGMSYAIVRPTLVFGRGDILLNNIAWGLRRSPLFPVSGSGRYRVQPVSVEDVAAICVDAGAHPDDVDLDAAGPEVYSYEELVRLVAATVGVRSRILHCPRPVMLAFARAAGLARRDVVVTGDELDGLEAGLLVSDRPALGQASFRSWLTAHAGELGRSYTSELARNFRPYDAL